MYSSPSRRLVGPTPLVVSGGFMPPSIIAVILGFPGLAEQFGRVGGLAIGPGGPLVPGGGALMLAPLGALVVALLVISQSREPTSVLRLEEVGRVSWWARFSLSQAKQAPPRGARVRSPVLSGVAASLR
jgi:hypothetical protein